MIIYNVKSRLSIILLGCNYPVEVSQLFFSTCISLIVSVIDCSVSVSSNFFRNLVSVVEIRMFLLSALRYLEHSVIVDGKLSDMSFLSWTVYWHVLNRCCTVSWSFLHRWHMLGMHYPSSSYQIVYYQKSIFQHHWNNDHNTWWALYFSYIPYAVMYMWCISKEVVCWFWGEYSIRRLQPFYDVLSLLHCCIGCMWWSFFL